MKWASFGVNLAGYDSRVYRECVLGQGVAGVPKKGAGRPLPDIVGENGQMGKFVNRRDRKGYYV